MPRIAFVAGDDDAGCDFRSGRVQTCTTRATLTHCGLREPEDLFVASWPFRVRVLVGLLHDLEIAALLARPVEDYAQPTAVALQGDYGYALELGANGHILADS